MSVQVQVERLSIRFTPDTRHVFSLSRTRQQLTGVYFMPECVGYVPNIVCTSGFMVHNSSFITPYAISDIVNKFARVDSEKLLSSIHSHG